MYFICLLRSMKLVTPECGRRRFDGLLDDWHGGFLELGRGSLGDHRSAPGGRSLKPSVRGRANVGWPRD